jgi:hypothetical protein
MKFRTKQQGFMLIGVLVFMAISVLVMTAFISWGQTSIRLSRRILSREQALDVAEAGVEHARWYLAHFQSDYALGHGGTNYGPHEYDFEDKDGNVIGTYTITVTPPPFGSTIVGIRSVGLMNGDALADRTINTRIAIPSLAKYAVVANDTMRFGQGTVVYGPLHSNGGVRFDGLAYNTVTSALSSYDDPDHNETGADSLEFGVHTHLDTNGVVNSSYRPLEVPPAVMQARTDVFRAGREFPVPAVDFAGITSDLSSIKSQAQSSGRYFAASGSQGYQMILRTNDTFDVYRVTGLVPAPNNCTSNGETGWGTWSVNTRVLLGNYAIPANGLVFFEDHVWVEGTINSARITIAAATFPDNSATRKSITVNNDLSYTNTDGTDVIALIAQNNINIGMVSQDDLRIDAALVAQNGRAGRFYYNTNCSVYEERDNLTLYGMIATNRRYGFAYTDGTGYATRTLTYDTNLLYAPPPNFPLAADNYQIISWEEVE